MNEGKPHAVVIGGGPAGLKAGSELTRRGARVTLLVPKGTPTDFSSVPAALRPIVSRVGAHLEASIVHDYLYDAWVGVRTEPLERVRLFADKVFRAGLLAARLPTWRRALMYQAVRRFGCRRLRSRSARIYTFFVSTPRGRLATFGSMWSRPARRWC